MSGLGSRRRDSCVGALLRLGGDPIDGQCEACGEPNPPGTQFCLFCGEYLGWVESPAPADDSPRPDGASRDVVQQPAHQGSPSDEAPKAADDEILEPVASESMPSSSQDAEDAVVVDQAPEPSAAVTVPQACPDCGLPVDPQLRFCGKCARPRGSSGPMVVSTPASTPTWWQRLLRTDDRRARRAYRRSLPTLYRWRRVAIGCAAIIALSFVFAIVGRNPAAWAQQRWYDAVDALVQVPGTNAEAVPEGSEVDGFPAAALVDADPGTAWATPWQDPPDDTLCGRAPGGRVEVNFPSTRLKEVRVVLVDSSSTSLQLRPASVDLTLPDGSCQRLPLAEKEEEQLLDFDSMEPISSVVLSIAQVHPSDDDRTQDEVGLGQLALFSRP